MNPLDWALTRDLSAPKKLLLVALAWVADDTGVTFKGQKTIAARLAKDPRWVRQHLPELAAEGLISRYRRHRMNGSRTSDLIVLNVPRHEAIDLTVYDGLVGDLEPGDREPSGGNSPQDLAAENGRPTGENPPGHTNQPGDRPVSTPNAPVRDARNDLPEGFPAELVPHAREVFRVLRAIAADHPGARRVWPKTVGLAIMAHPRKPLVATAHDLAGWAVDPPSPIVDVVARYRAFLKRERELAAAERLPGEGPAAAPGGNVTPLRPNASEAERRRARQEDRLRRAAEPEPAVARGQIGPGA